MTSICLERQPDHQLILRIKAVLMVGIALIVTGWASRIYAQELTPMQILIERQNQRFKEESPKVIDASAERHQHRVTGRATAWAKTERGARAAAANAAYARSLRLVLSQRDDIQLLGEREAELMAEVHTLASTVTREKRTSQGYNVEVQVDLPAERLTSEIRSEGLSQNRIVALLPEYVDGSRQPTSMEETKLVGSLAQTGLAVYQPSQEYSADVLSRMESSAQGSGAETGGQLGVRYLAGTLIVGSVKASFSQDNDGIISYTSEANYRIIHVETGQIIAADDLTAKGFGQDKTQASRNALENMAPHVIDSILSAVGSRTVGSKTIEVDAGHASKDDLAAMQALLSGLKGVSNVVREDTPSGTKFSVTSQDSPISVASEIEGDPNYYASILRP